MGDTFVVSDTFVRGDALVRVGGSGNGDRVVVLSGRRLDRRSRIPRPESAHHRRVKPSPGAVGSFITPPEIEAPANGSFLSRAAPSRSTMSSSGVKCAAAVMPI